MARSGQRSWVRPGGRGGEAWGDLGPGGVGRSVHQWLAAALLALMHSVA
jgi:hypothetical protein